MIASPIIFSLRRRSSRIGTLFQRGTKGPVRTVPRLGQSAHPVIERFLLQLFDLRTRQTAPPRARPMPDAFSSAKRPPSPCQKAEHYEYRSLLPIIHRPPASSRQRRFNHHPAHRQDSEICALPNTACQWEPHTFLWHIGRHRDWLCSRQQIRGCHLELRR